MLSSLMQFLHIFSYQLKKVFFFCHPFKWSLGAQEMLTMMFILSWGFSRVFNIMNMFANLFSLICINLRLWTSFALDKVTNRSCAPEVHCHRHDHYQDRNKLERNIAGEWRTWCGNLTVVFLECTVWWGPVTYNRSIISIGYHLGLLSSPLHHQLLVFRWHFYKLLR